MLWLENASTLHAVISANLILYMHGSCNEKSQNIKVKSLASCRHDFAIFLGT